MMSSNALIHAFNSVDLQGRPLYLAIGMFDGVHLGHQAVVKKAVADAKNSDGVSGVLTFWPHPSRLLRPESPVLMIMPPEQKAVVLNDLGVDWIIQQDFNAGFAAIPAEDFLPFLQRVLPSLRAVYVGENFFFGKNRRGNLTLLKEQGSSLGIKIFGFQPVGYCNETISSTLIRQHLKTGDIEYVRALIGRPYSCEGIVRLGRQLGRKLGFPTLNLLWSPELKPCYGVYAVHVSYAACGRFLPGVANYGLRPTVDDKDQEPVLEIHLLTPPEKGSWLQPGDRLHVEWLRFFRKEKGFSSLEALREQIALDKQAVLEYFKTG